MDHRRKVSSWRIIEQEWAVHGAKTGSAVEKSLTNLSTSTKEKERRGGARREGPGEARETKGGPGEGREAR